MSHNKNIIIAIIIASCLIILAFIIKTGGNNERNNQAETLINNVSIVDGIQIIEIKAKGGYQPRISQAKADIPTILRFNTKGTFDCSSSIIIPSLKIAKNLPQNGSTDVDIGSQEIGLLRGSCGMGMYPFQINFQ